MPVRFGGILRKEHLALANCMVALVLTTATADRDPGAEEARVHKHRALRQALGGWRSSCDRI